MYTVAVIVGSLRKGSINKQLAKALALEGQDLFDFQFVPIDDVPLYNEDIESDPPSPVIALRQAIKDADVTLFVTPEYNRGIPGVMKNIIDWASRPPGKSCVIGKPTAIMGTSGSPVGTAVAQFQMRSMLPMIGMLLVRQPELYIVTKPDMYKEDGSLSDASTRSFLRGFLEGMKTWLDDHKK